MPVYSLRGVSVSFPFEAYQCQLVYMERVIEALQRGKNALLESPTGTGKTLCLLCASLAYRQHLREIARSAPVKPEPGTAAAEDPEADLSAAPLLIYATRTHSQIAQVVRELKQSGYQPKMSVLSSRAQSCVNEAVLTQEPGTVDGLCRTITSQKTPQDARCRYYLGPKVKDAAKFFTTYDQSTGSEKPIVADVEDIVAWAKGPNPANKAMCPYYLSRELAGSAEILFMPYNYLLDPQFRRTAPFRFDGAVIILDEAHNIEGICSDVVSLDVSAGDLANAVAATDLCVALLEGGSASVPDDEQASGLDEPRVLVVKNFLIRLEGAVHDLKLEVADGIRSVTRPGGFLLDLLSAAGASDPDVIRAVHTDLGAVETVLSASASNSSHTAKIKGLAKVVSLLEVADKRRASLADVYKVHVRSEDDGGAGGRGRRRGAIQFTSDKQQGEPERRTLSLWCFHPGLAMSLLQDTNIRNLILTSGTLSPMDSYAQELDVEFPIRLENPHVVQPDQVLISVVTRGPSGKQLNSSYQNRSSHGYLSDLGNSVVNYARIVPDGLLMFFPSYTVMSSTIEFWKANPSDAPSIWDRISRHKTPVVEPRNSAELAPLMDSFYQAIAADRGGAIFFAVCRGKVSEGLDFANERGRAVIISGIPFANVKEPKVKFKRQFLDTRFAQRKTHLSGNTWYSQQALRAVNQAIGRVIRHRGDYGAIILADDRFAPTNMRNQLSMWLRPHVAIQQSFGESSMALTRFFKNKVRSAPAPAPVPAAKAASAAGGPPRAPFMPHTASNGPGAFQQHRMRGTRPGLVSLGAIGGAPAPLSSSAAAAGLGAPVPAPSPGPAAPPELTKAERKAQIARYVGYLRNNLGPSDYAKLTAALSAYRQDDDANKLVEVGRRLFGQGPDALAYWSGIMLFMQPARARSMCPLIGLDYEHLRALKMDKLFADHAARKRQGAAAATSSKDLITGKPVRASHKRKIADADADADAGPGAPAAPAGPKNDDFFAKPVGCVFCQKHPDKPFSARCGHVACQACWLQEAEASKSATLTCPKCGVRSHRKQLSRTFFLPREDQI